MTEMTAIFWVVLLCASLEATAEKPQEPQRKEDPNPICVIKTSMGNIHVELFAKEAPRTVGNFIELAQGKREFTDPRTGRKVKRPFYDNLVFHRVIKNFMIQGGCPKGNGSGGPGYTFEDEINATALGLDKMKAIQPGNKPHRYLLIRSQDAYRETVLLPLYRRMGITSREQFQSRIKEVERKLSQLTLKECYENMGYRYNDERDSHPPKRGMLAMANSGPNTNGSQFFINLVDTPWLAGKHTVFGEVIKGMEVVDKVAGVPVGKHARPVKDVKVVSIRLRKPKQKNDTQETGNDGKGRKGE